MYGDSYIFSAAIGILKYLEPHLLQQDEMTVGKLLKNVVACRMQFEQDQPYPIEAYERPALWRECEFIVKSCRLLSCVRKSCGQLGQKLISLCLFRRGRQISKPSTASTRVALTQSVGRDSKSSCSAAVRSDTVAAKQGELAVAAPHLCAHG